MMKILHICKTFPPDTFGGVEYFAQTLATKTSEFGVQNSILVCSRNPHQKNTFQEKFNLIRKKTTVEFASCPFSLSMIPTFKKMIEKTDIVQLHFPWPYADLLVNLFGRKVKKLLITYHSDIVKQKVLKNFYRPLMKMTLDRACKIVTTSPNLKINSEDLANFADKTISIPSAINQHYYYPLLNSSKIEYWKNKIGNNFFLFIGQFRYYKGIEVLLNAIKGTEIPLVLLGSGPIENDLKKLAHTNNLQKVHFLGSLADEDKIPLLHLCKAVVLPSIFRTEAFGLALIEGAAFKKPLISTELGTGTSYVNLDGETGFVVPPNNPQELQKAMSKIFSDDALAQKMGEAAFARFESNFSIEKVAQQYMQCYEKICS